METEQPKIKPIAYTYGLYIGLLTVAGLVIQYAAGLERNWVLSIISFVITVLIFYYGIKAYKQQNRSYLSIKEALKVGMGIAVIGGLIGGIYAYVHYSFIQPEFIETIREQAYLDMTTQNPNMTEEQMATGEKMMNIFTSPFFMGTMILLSTLFFGFLISLISGAIMKKSDPNAA